MTAHTHTGLVGITLIANGVGKGRDMLGKGRLTTRLRREFRYLRGLMKHPRTPRHAVWLIGAGLAYLVSPVDLIPDFIPIIGQLDDALVLGVCIGLALLLIPRDVKASTRRRSQLMRAAKGGVLPPTPFETEALPWEFGVRIVPQKQPVVSGPMAYDSMIELLFRNHLVIADLSVQQNIITPNGTKPFQVQGLDCKVFTRDSGSRYLYLDPSYSRGEIIEFVDLVAAYQGLPAEVRDRIDPLHLYGSASIDGVVQNLRLSVVVTHPYTGEKCLNANIFRPETDAVYPSRTVAMLDFLRRHIRRRSFHYVHRFKPNEIVVWDGMSIAKNSTAAAETNGTSVTHTGYQLTPSLQRLPSPSITN